MIVRAIDIRKTEMHWTCLSTDEHVRNRIFDYDVRTHEGASQETTVEQAEELIYLALHNRADEWESGYQDTAGGTHGCDLTLVDKGWKGSWNTEDGEDKSWASQPVERFCIERGLRRYMPAKGAAGYRSPAPAKGVYIGDHWHINTGKGAERACDELIWDVSYYRSLVEDLFMIGSQPMDDSDPMAIELAEQRALDRYELFIAEGGHWSNHKRFAEHIREGAQELSELRRTNSRKRKRRRRRDHWWDAMCQAMVAKSVETFIREKVRTKKPKRSLQEMAQGK